MLATSRYYKITSDIVLPILTILSVIGVFFFVYFAPIFSIKEIICLSDYKPCANDNLLAELAKIKGQNLFIFDPSDLKAKLLRGDFMLKSVIVTKHLPSIIEIDTLSVNPSIAFQLISDPNTWVLCDELGRVISVRQISPNVPVILVDSLPSFRVGERLPGDKYQAAQKLTLAILDTKIDYKSVVLLDDTSLALKLNSGVSAIFTAAKSVSDQVSALQAILADGTIKHDYKTIDLRFAQAILRQN